MGGLSTHTHLISNHRLPLESCKRVAIVGVTGSGKTTLAHQISRILGIPHIELDALHWGPNWTPAPTEVFVERVAKALSGNAWVADGNYRAVRDLVWGRADMIVWLDYSLPLIMRRLIMRTLRRVVLREELWNENRERLSAQFLSRDSLLLWAIQSYPARRKEYPRLLSRPEYSHLLVVRLCSPRATSGWLSSFVMYNAR